MNCSRRLRAHARRLTCLVGASVIATLCAPSAAPAAETCPANSDPYHASKQVLEACGVRLLPRSSTTPLPGGGIEANYVQSDGSTISFTQPPSSFDAATASASELALYGVPPKPPAGTSEYSRWAEMVANGIHFVTPPAALAELPPKQGPDSPGATTRSASGQSVRSTVAPSATTGRTTNWSGYFNWNGKGSYTHATGYFVEPSDHGSCSNASAYTWAGIGGWYNKNLGQDGTAQSVPGLGNHQSWTEILPALPVATNLYASPGHWFIADTEYTGGGNYSFYLYNYATKEAAHASGKGGVDANVAEYIVERPGSYNLFNFGSVAFQGFTNGKAFGNYPVERINMVNEKGELNAAPGGISSKYAFNDQYYHCTGSGEGSSGGEGEGTPPVATTGSASGVSGSQATLNGSVNPEGAETTYHFEYGTEAESYSASTPDTSAGSGTSAVPASAAISGLAPGTTYHFRLIANSPNGVSAGVDQQFTTTGSPPPPPPTVTTEGVTAVTNKSATPEAVVNPNGLDTHYYFEYGTISTRYESSAPPPPGSDAGSGSTPVRVSAALSGLAPFTTYYYRVVASNSTGTSYGEEKSFKTLAWSVQSTPNPEELPGSFLHAVSCPSTSACLAVGEDFVSNRSTVGLAESWNGTIWESKPPLNPSGSKDAVLEGVACTSSTNCLAVGRWSAKAGSSPTAFSEQWNGSKWTLLSTPAPTGATFSWLDEISCTSASACTAVGFWETKSGFNHPLAERWNGSAWSVQTVPFPEGSEDAVFGGVSCPSATVCEAVGSSLGTTLAERWNGSAWSVQTTPNVTGRENLLNAVSCVSTSECFAVGRDGGASSSSALSERWGGTTWEIVPIPSASETGSNSLTSVSCSSSTTCTAVGDYGLGTEPSRPAAEFWNGAAWELEPPALVSGAPYGDLESVSCPLLTTCTATGYYETPGGQAYTLAERSEFTP